MSGVAAYGLGGPPFGWRVIVGRPFELGIGYDCGRRTVWVGLG